MPTTNTSPALLAKKYLAIYWKQGVFPVDPVTIAINAGVEVLEAQLPNNVSGALIKEAGKDPQIILEVRDQPNRKRFSCGHELGHYADRVESKNDDRNYEYVDFRDSHSSSGQNPEEVFANQFAACLLMPDFEVEKRAKKYSHFELAAFFGVSNEAMKYRLKSLHLLK